METTQNPNAPAERIWRFLPMRASDGDLPRRWMVSKERVGTVGEWTQIDSAACAGGGEIAANNRVGRALSALTHHRKQD